MSRHRTGDRAAGAPAAAGTGLASQPGLFDAPAPQVAAPPPAAAKAIEAPQAADAAAAEGRRLARILDESVAVEMEDARAAGSLGFMANALVQVTLPHRDPKSVTYERTNGSLTLSIITPKALGGVPFGSVPRMVLAWICTEAVRTKDKTLDLGRSRKAFMEKLQMAHDGRNAATLRAQTTRLLGSLVTVIDKRAGKVSGLRNVLIADTANLQGTLLWDSEGMDGAAGADDDPRWVSQLKLSDDFFRQVCDSPVPLDLRVLNALRQSPLAMDIYAWLHWRLFTLARSDRGSQTCIPWEALQMQFGAAYGLHGTEVAIAPAKRREIEAQGRRDFRKRFLERLNEVLVFYPAARDMVEATATGLVLRAPSARAVSYAFPGLKR